MSPCQCWTTPSPIYDKKRSVCGGGYYIGKHELSNNNNNLQSIPSNDKFKAESVVQFERNEHVDKYDKTIR